MATTVIYTYLHTLSLHDALPSCAGCVRPGADDRRAARRGQRHRRRRAGGGASGGAAQEGHIDRHHRRAGPRSEEHTSELQSLMRISSAVLCLTNKNTHFDLYPLMMQVGHVRTTECDQFYV